MRLSGLVLMPPEYQEGIATHRRIDAFTDSHPIVRQSISRISPGFRRFGGVLVDVFYDHYLSRQWDLYCEVALPDFLREVYASFEVHQHHLPESVNIGLQQMKVQDWLSSYGTLAGIQLTLGRIDTRLKRSYQLGDAVIELESNYEALFDDFNEFFPQLRAYIGLPTSPLL